MWLTRRSVTERGLPTQPGTRFLVETGPSPGKYCSDEIEHNWQMSFAFAIRRLRWSLKRCVLAEWYVGLDDQIRPGDRICSLDTDRGALDVVFDDREDGWVCEYYVAQGQAVALDGLLLEWSNYAPGRRQLRRTPPPQPAIRRSPKVMLSFRKTDTGMQAGRLYDALVRQYSGPDVFFSDESLQGGEDWLSAIQTAATSCRVMVVLVGPKWELDERLRLDWDSLHREILAALDNRIPIIPVHSGHG